MWTASLFVRWEDALGMESPHLRETGVFAHPVGLGPIVLPRGWEHPLVPFGRDEALFNVRALEIHDLAISGLSNLHLGSWLNISTRLSAALLAAKKLAKLAIYDNGQHARSQNTTFRTGQSGGGTW